MNSQDQRDHSPMIIIPGHWYIDALVGSWAAIINTSQWHNGYLQNGSNADGDSVRFQVWVPKGVNYYLDILTVLSASNAIVKPTWDGLDLSTTDLYNGGFSGNINRSWAIGTVPKSKHLNIDFTVTGRNGSASDWYFRLTEIQIYSWNP